MIKRKVIVIGLDGACWEIIKLGIAEGKLPTIQKLIDEGVSGEINSTIPDITWPAWTSAITGVDPGKHNILNFVICENNRYRILTAADRRCDPIWKILSREGLKVGVVNVPVTYPPDRDIEGYMISGHGVVSIDSEFTYPSELKERILSKGYRLDGEANLKLLDLQWILETEEVKKRVVLELIRDTGCDFFMVVFISTDFVQHMKWRYLDPLTPGYEPLDAETAKNDILKVYSSLDDFLKDMMQIIGGTAEVLILSDHGFGSTHKVFNVNSWLKDQGYLAISKTLSKSVMFKLGLSQKNFSKFMHLLASAMPKSIKNKIRKRQFVDGAKRRLPSSEYGISFAKTRAWFYKECCIKINLKGREPGGIVDESQYETIRDALIRELKELSDPETGEKVVEAAYKREEIYHGNYVGNAADIIIQLREGYRPSVKPTADRWIEPQDPKERGYHRQHGIFIAYGPSIKSGVRIELTNMVDVTPTILHMFGIPIPDYIDGRVLMEIFMEGSDEAHRIPSYTHYGERDRIKAKIGNPMMRVKLVRRGKG